MQAKQCGALIVHCDVKLRNADLLLDLQIDHARHGCHFVAELGGNAAECVEVFAVDLERDLGAHTRQHVVEPMRDRLANIGGNRQHGEFGANILDDLFFGA